MNDEEQEVHDVAAASPYGTARVADSYGVNPHEHKPSQDTWSADDADDKQAETGGAQLQPGEALANEEESSPGSSSEQEQSSDDSSSKTSDSSDSKPARTTASRTSKAPTGSSTARSTASDPKGK